MTSILKNVHVDKSDYIANKYGNTYHRTIKINPIEVKTSAYIDFDVEYYHKDPKFKIGDHVRMSQYKKLFAKGYTPKWSVKDFEMTKVKSTVALTYVMKYLNSEEINGTLYGKILQKTN